LRRGATAGTEAANDDVGEVAADGVGRAQHRYQLLHERVPELLGTDPPMLLIVGSDDTLVPTKQTIEMVKRLAAAGVKHDVIVLPGINHSFIGRTAEATRDANLKALAATFEFIDRTIGNRSSTAR